MHPNNANAQGERHRHTLRRPRGGTCAATPRNEVHPAVVAGKRSGNWAAAALQGWDEAWVSSGEGADRALGWTVAGARLLSAIQAL